MADGASRIETGPLTDLNRLNPYLQGAYELMAAGAGIATTKSFEVEF